MGSHRLMAYESIFAGSNTKKIVRNSSTPILALNMNLKSSTLIQLL